MTDHRDAQPISRFPSLGDRPGAPNTVSLIGEVFLTLGGLIAERVAAAGFPQRRSHSLVFAHIDVDAGSRLTELAQRVNMTPQAMSDIVNDMVRRGYLERRPDPGDKRAKLIYLTDRGRSAVNQGRVVIADLEAHIEEALGAESLETFRVQLFTLRTADL